MTRLGISLLPELDGPLMMIRNGSASNREVAARCSSAEAICSPTRPSAAMSCWMASNSLGSLARSGAVAGCDPT